MLEREFLGFINDNQLVNSTDRVLLAVSGGLDSMVMAELFHQTGQLFAIAHVNFGLRGAESEADAVFVQNKAEQYEVPFHLTRFDTVAIAAERGSSIQMAARDLRYDWFAQLCRQHNYSCVATAHHKNDVLETLLLNLTRGTGLAGLHGIAVQQDRGVAGRIIRPLLFATRDELARYIDERSLTYREDSSNINDKYARNRIRHRVVPVLADLNPGLWQTLPATIERLRAAEALVRAELNRSWQEVAEYRGKQVFLSANKLLNQPEFTFRVGEWLKPFGFTGDQIGQIVKSLDRVVGQVFQSATHRITHERNGLFLEPLPNRLDYEIVLTEWPSAPFDVADQFMLTVELVDKPTDFRPPTDPSIACLDADQLLFPLTIRPWRQGDRFRPLGLNGHKLVSDLLNDLKLNRSEREQTAILISDDQPAWVIGRRIAHRFRITAQTKRIAQFIWERK